MSAVPSHMPAYQTDHELLNLETDLFLEAIFVRYGYDFRDYSRAHIKRRLLSRIQLDKVGSLTMLTHKVLHEPGYFQLILKDLSINVTEMYRDPEFFLQLRKEVVPLLKTYPFLNIWLAGCSTGEEVYSIAILLREEGLLERVQLYATDFNPHVLEVAKKGIYPISRIKEFTSNYQQAGGTNSFSDYYVADYQSAIFDKTLKKNIVFAEHNLVTDKVFAEMHLIICRNVLIYFNRALQDKVIKLFDESLINGGYLCLGTKETLQFSEIARDFDTIDASMKIYKKKIR